MPTDAIWRKSSFSGEGSNGSSCVEVAFLPDGEVGLRDTKDRTVPPHHYPATEWSAFIAGVRTGQFEKP